MTVRGRPVARLVPPGDAGQPRVDVDRATLRSILALPVDEGLAADLDAAEAPLDDPWSRAGDVLAVARSQRRGARATDLLIIATAAVTGRELYTLDAAQSHLSLAAGVPTTLLAA